MKRTTIKSRAGFTLIEILLVLGMLGIVMGAIFSLYRTHQGSAYTEEETVDVQQNLRIAMESISRDIRMGGFMIPADNPDLPNSSALYNNNVPVGFYQNNNGLVSAELVASQAVDPLYKVASDTLTLNTASAAGAAGVHARIDENTFAVTVPGTDITFTVDSNNYFDDNQVVRIIDPVRRLEVGSPALSITYTIQNIGNTNAECNPKLPPCMVLRPAAAGAATAVEYKRGDVIFRVTSAVAPYPNTIQYLLVNNADVNTCPAGQLCLARRVNGVDTQIVANNISGLQFRYLLEDGTETDTPLDLQKIRSVRVALWGETVATTAYTDRRAKIRTISSVVNMRNKQ